MCVFAAPAERYTNPLIKSVRLHGADNHTFGKQRLKGFVSIGDLEYFPQ